MVVQIEPGCIAVLDPLYLYVASILLGCFGSHDIEAPIMSNSVNCSLEARVQTAALN